MPNVLYPSGLTEFENMNKNSTHPNPWGPPSMFDQVFHQVTSINDVRFLGIKVHYVFYKQEMGLVSYVTHFDSFAYYC